MSRSSGRNLKKAGLGLLLLCVLSILAGCGKTSETFVAVSSQYQSRQIKRVALIGFTDYPGMEGSGEVTAGIFEKYLLSARYTLVERRQVDEVLKEQALQASGVLNQDTLEKLGQLLGVNALVLGNINEFKNQREQTVMVQMPQSHSSPVYGEVEVTQKNGDTTVKTTQKVITGFNYSWSSKTVPQVEQVPARVGLSARLVDVRTG
ncbi:MAG: CsgG/HfaB family protein, partial [bacterium]|nr:CsgG/HfaB family protein [bacterium]